MQADQSTCPNCHQLSEPWRNQDGVWLTKQDGKEWWLNSQTNAWQMYRINKYCPNCLAEMQPTDSTCSECGTVSNALATPTG
jgi:RNA polymerase subunit RPABC4/transcription elongation factor Spt4